MVTQCDYVCSSTHLHFGAADRRSNKVQPWLFFHQRIKAFHSLKFKKHFYNFYKKHFLSSYFDCLNKWLDIKDYFYFFHPLINQESTNKAFFIVSVSEVFLKYIWRTNYSCSGNLPEVFLSSVQTRHDSSVQTVEATESSWLFMRWFPFLKWSNSLCVRFFETLLWLFTLYSLYL